MQIFGLTIGRTKELPLSPVGSSSWFPIGPIMESAPGNWQRNVVTDSDQNLLAFSAVFSCVTLIAKDIAKLRIKLVERTGKIYSDPWIEIEDSPFYPVLRKPNRYQTRIQFLEQWIVSKLLYGNTYALKQRDQRGIVTDLYILDPRRAMPLVAPDGAVYYRINQDALAGAPEGLVVPAKEIIHDRMTPLWHPLVGVSPLYASAASATQGNRIQADSAKFFENMSRPSGQLTAPGTIKPDTAARLKNLFESSFSGTNLGRLFVSGDGLKYEPMTIPAAQAQLIEQLRWTGEDVARSFHVPKYKIGIGEPTHNNAGLLNQEYYSQTLQGHIEDIEALLDEGLELPTRLGTELDLEGLLRMDPLSRYDAYGKAVGAGWMAPNEARYKENYVKVPGGDTPYLQEQNYALSALAKRDAQADPFAVEKPAAEKPVAPAADDDEDDEKDDDQARELADALIAKFLKETVDA